MSLQRSILPIFVILGVIITTASGWASCDVAFIRALRTEFELKSTENLASVAYELACTSSQKATSTSGSGYGFSGSLDQNAVRHACQSKDYQFFSNHRLDIALSYIPSNIDLNDLCGPREGLNFDVRHRGNQIIVEAAWKDVTGKVPSITVQEFIPSGPVECVPSGLVNGAEIRRGGNIAACKRTRPEGVISFALITDLGGAMFAFLEPAKSAPPPKTYAFVKGEDDIWVSKYFRAIKCPGPYRNLDNGLARGLSRFCYEVGDPAIEPAIDTGRVYGGRKVYKCRDGWTNALGVTVEGSSALCIDTERRNMTKARKVGIYAKFWAIYRCPSSYINIQSGVSDGISGVCFKQ